MSQRLLSRSARADSHIPESRLLTALLRLQLLFTAALLLLFLVGPSILPPTPESPPDASGLRGLVKSITSLKRSAVTEDPARDYPPFPPPQLPVVALFLQQHLRRLDAAARQCGLIRDPAISWRDEPRKGRSSVSYEELLRVDEPGIPGSFFDTAVDFRYIGKDGSLPNASTAAPPCRPLLRGTDYSALRLLPIVREQPPCPLLYAAPLAGNHSGGGLEESGQPGVIVPAKWGEGECTEGWAVRRVEERERSAGRLGEGRSGGGGRMEGGDPLRVLAVVFPQFHAIPENDRFWGRNFTEWDNLRRVYFSRASLRAIPHPLASTGGYHNLLSLPTRHRMALTARTYGIHGFCYHHYWFGCNRTLLEQPLLRMLEDGEPDMPFCLLWANEEWTTRWDSKKGGGERVLLAQTYGGEECWRNHFMWLLPFFRHEKYIKVEGRPMFLIYNLRHIPPATRSAMLLTWQRLAQQHGLPGLHLVESLTHHKAVTRPGQGSTAKTLNPRQGSTVKRSALSVEERSSADSDAKGSVTVGGPVESERSGEADLGEAPVVQAVMEYRPNYGRWDFRPAPEGKRFPVHYRGEHVGWDNSPRHAVEEGYMSRVDVHDDPVHVEARLTARMRLARKDMVESGAEKESYFFVTAWNEWGEGNALEPNNVYGFGYLNALARAIVRSRRPALTPCLVAKKLERILEECKVGPLDIEEHSSCSETRSSGDVALSMSDVAELISARGRQGEETAGCRLLRARCHLEFATHLVDEIGQ